ncbi:MAG: hypothetical protein JSV79_06360, partial [Armatimonadota bacterium]
MGAIWTRTAVGLVLAVGGGLAFGHALGEGQALLWWVGGLIELAGVMLVLSAIYKTRAKPREAGEEYALGLRDEGEPVVPLLGALLVYKCRVLTQEQLSRALEEQLGDDRRKRRLGEILLEMGMVTESQLAEALEQQRLYVRGRREV